MPELKDQGQSMHGPAEDKNVATPAKGGPAQQGADGVRQQGDQDLGADSKSSPDSQGMK